MADLTGRVTDLIGYHVKISAPGKRTRTGVVLGPRPGARNRSLRLAVSADRAIAFDPAQWTVAVLHDDEYSYGNLPLDLLAERTLDITTTGDPDAELTLREAIRAMLAAVLPAYELRLGAELASLTMPCPKHYLPGIIQADCVPCHRHSALVGARYVIEHRDGYAGLIRRAVLQEADDGTG